jgi:hypothetical protein
MKILPFPGRIVPAKGFPDGDFPSANKILFGLVFFAPEEPSRMRQVRLQRTAPPW